ncbi:MAG TPA: DUF4235 domain-containing protein [Vicinamibacterales bacterium]|nr:DUF4235 domain-containing protein [Vicinamibacterales bacterium]
MKLLYRPFGIVMGILAGLLSKKIFDLVWGLIDEEEPPKAKTAETTWTKLIIASALQAVTFKVVRATVDRAGAKGFEKLTGTWPGDEQPDQSQASKFLRSKPQASSFLRSKS